jgi:hypothetical protein
MLLNSEQTKQVELERGIGRAVTGIFVGLCVVGFFGVIIAVLARVMPGESIVLIASLSGASLLSGLVIWAIATPIIKNKKEALKEKNKVFHYAYLLDQRFNEIDQILKALYSHVDKQRSVADIIDSARQAVKEKVDKIDSAISSIKSVA